jgi:hypothetical protein
MKKTGNPDEPYFLTPTPFEKNSQKIGTIMKK